MESARVGIVLRAAAVEHGREIGAAAEPGRDVTTMRVFMCTAGTFGFHGCAMQRDAGGPEARILLGAWDLLAEFGREFAMHGRDVDADLLEDAPLA